MLDFRRAVAGLSSFLLPNEETDDEEGKVVVDAVDVPPEIEIAEDGVGGGGLGPVEVDELLIVSLILLLFA